jgi:transposase
MKNSLKYVGMDVHKEMTVIAVLDAVGKQLSRSVVQTSSTTIVSAIRAIDGPIHLTFEEGIHSAWLYDLLKPYVAHLIVCNPNKIKKTNGQNKSDDIDAFNLANLLRLGELKAVYHGQHSLRALQELAHSYQYIVSDCTRIKNRITALFRARAIAYRGDARYQQENRNQWLAKLEPAVQLRAQLLFAQLDTLLPLREQAEKALVKEARKHEAFSLISSIPYLGDIRTALILSVMLTPFRFRSKRPLWCYSGFAVVTSTSADYQQVNGRIIKTNKHSFTRGLNHNFNRTLKNVFKSAANAANAGVFKQYYDALLAKGLKDNLARLSLARKIATVTLTLWKKGECFNPDKFLTNTK